ncbi:hypothetical protein AJ80_02724 [Polytolypa hystricis UAMH7299]|uniref:Transcription factor domain-containing protein n=1 Tax=Polytolypa hystricis (strain UAMH7299) TaxID=1447883 RepID=A0A2B7YGI1_POLH7|nr:hypothetical protein AJ80_02724 [Polytolypa hystricis UAMH7299]
MVNQVNQLQNALNEARAALSLPALPNTDDFEPADEIPAIPERESSEEVLNPVDGNMAPDTLASAPIKSLYEVTKPRDTQESGDVRFSGLVIEPDFIARGVVTFPEADQLTNAYLGRLDHFFYEHAQKYADLAEIRKTSTLLAVTICTVAALHDPLGSDAYDKLSRELRNLTSSLIFRQRIGLEDIKALCMASYWLGDMTWILSALVVRKAISMQYHMTHLSQPNTDKEGFIRSQMWLLIYLANEQVSLLRGAPASSVDRDFINWEAHMSSPYSGEIDLRLVSHIDLLLLLSHVRQLYGIDTMKPIPPHLVPQLHDFMARLDHYGQTWMGRLARNKRLGNFPSEAVKLHWRFAKFFICSHAFRGLNSGSSSVSLHPELEDIAASGITTAISILELLIESDELRACLVGIPHYFHTMFAFAAVFLLKAATRYRQHVNIDLGVVFSISRRVLEVFSHCPCARQHLVHRIARGLKEMIEKYEAQIIAEERDMGKNNAIAAAIQGAGKVVHADNTNNNNNASSSTIYPLTSGQDDILPHDMVQWLDLENFDFLSMSPPSWNTNFDI